MTNVQRESEIVGLCVDFCGTVLEIAADSEAWLEKIRGAFPGMLGSGGGATPDFTLRIFERSISAPVDALPLTWSGRMTDGNFGRIYETESSAVLDVRDGGILSIDHANREASAYFPRHAMAKFFGTAIMMVIDAALTAGQQYLIHAATLVEWRSRRAVMICAPSGAGKTTTSIALAGKGFDFMTDDASVLVPELPHPCAWGLPRALKVHRKTAQLLPWLGPLPDRWNDEEEQGIAIEDLPDRISVADIGPVELGAILTLGQRCSGPHEISKIDKSRMLIDLAMENVAWRPAGMVPKAVSKFAALARAIAPVQTFTLSAGPDLDTLPDIVANAMNAELDR